MNIKWNWYPPRNANKITVRMKDFTEYDIFAGPYINHHEKFEKKPLYYLRIHRYNPKGYKTTVVLYKTFPAMGPALLAGHRITENLISNGGAIL